MSASATGQVEARTPDVPVPSAAAARRRSASTSMVDLLDSRLVAHLATLIKELVTSAAFSNFLATNPTDASVLDFAARNPHMLPLPIGMPFARIALYFPCYRITVSLPIAPRLDPFRCVCKLCPSPFAPRTRSQHACRLVVKENFSHPPLCGCNARVLVQLGSPGWLEAQYQSAAAAESDCHRRLAVGYITPAH